MKTKHDFIESVCSFRACKRMKIGIKKHGITHRGEIIIKEGYSSLRRLVKIYFSLFLLTHSTICLQLPCICFLLLKRIVLKGEGDK